MFLQGLGVRGKGWEAPNSGPRSGQEPLTSPMGRQSTASQHPCPSQTAGQLFP